MTMVAGATDVVWVQHLLRAAEARLVPTRLFEETSLPRRLLGAGYRVATLIALDLPQDHFLMVVAHEVYGHGARLRELGAPAIGYQFDGPIPYGKGGASTRFELPPETTSTTRAGLAIAGIEAQEVLAAALRSQALARGAWDHRQAWLYLESRLAGFGYIRSVSARSGEGHDVAAFLRDVNAACAPPTCRALEARTLKRRALLMLADPLLVSAAYGVVISYVGLGRRESRVPMIPLPGGRHYLPALDFAMTPYGTEWGMRHHARTRNQLATLTFRLGDTSEGRTWGVGARVTRRVRGPSAWATASLQLWRQPRLDGPADTRGLQTGALATLAADVPLAGARAGRRSVGLSLEAGYKSAGFVPGEPLRAGGIFRVGVSVGGP
jgi:hypothetical protein